MKVPLKHGAVLERGRRKKNGKGKKREKEKSSTRFCCAEESGCRVLVAAVGKLGVGQVAPDPKGRSLSAGIAKGHSWSKAAAGGGWKCCQGHSWQSPLQADTSHFPPKRARIHWPDSAACAELGAEEKIAPRFRRRSSFWSSLWHGLSSGASKGARNMCWNLSGGDKP